MMSWRKEMNHNHISSTSVITINDSNAIVRLNDWFALDPFPTTLVVSSSKDTSQDGSLQLNLTADTRTLSFFPIMWKGDALHGFQSICDHRLFLLRGFMTEKEGKVPSLWYQETVGHPLQRNFWLRTEQIILKKSDMTFAYALIALDFKAVDGKCPHLREKMKGIKGKDKRVVQLKEKLIRKRLHFILIERSSES